MRRPVWLILLVLGVVSLATAAQSGGPLMSSGYDLSWNTVDGGGGASTGGAYILRGTLGQLDAGQVTGGVYVLRGGFWSGAEAAFYQHLPVIQRAEIP